MQERIADALVDLAADGQEGADVALEQAASVLLVEVSEHSRGYDAQICAVLVCVGSGIEASDAPAGMFGEVHNKVISPGPRTKGPEESTDIPDVILDRHITDRAFWPVPDLRA